MPETNFLESAEAGGSVFFDKKFFELMYCYCSKDSGRKAAARAELCRVYVPKYKETFGKMNNAKMLAVNSLMEEFKKTGRKSTFFVAKFIDLTLEEEEVKKR